MRNSEVLAHARRRVRRRSRHVLFFALAISCSPILTALDAAAQTQVAQPSLAKTEAELQSRLQSPTSVSFTGSQIRNAALKIAKNLDFAVAIDRRVDPELPVDLSSVDTPAAAIFQGLAERNQLGYTTFGPMIYLGPTSITRDLKTLAAIQRDDAGRAPPALKAELFSQGALVCEAPCETRALWQSLTTEAGLRTTNPERMPFDVWPAIHWAPLSLVDRLTLVAVQFDLSFKLDTSAKTVTFEPRPIDATLERSYPAGPKPLETLAKFRTLAPGAAVRASGAKITVVGKYEDHERITAAPAAANNPNVKNTNVPPAPAVQLFTLRVKDVPLSELIRVLQEKHKLKIRVDEAAIQAAGLSLEGRTEVDVTKVALEQLLDQAAAPLKLAARRVGDTVEIGVRTPGAK